MFNENTEESVFISIIPRNYNTKNMSLEKQLYELRPLEIEEFMSQVKSWIIKMGPTNLPSTMQALCNSLAPLCQYKIQIDSDFLIDLLHKKGLYDYNFGFIYNSWHENLASFSVQKKLIHLENTIREHIQNKQLKELAFCRAAKWILTTPPEMLPKKPQRFFNTLKEFCTFTVQVDQKFVLVQLKMQGYIKEENNRVLYTCFNDNFNLTLSQISMSQMECEEILGTNCKTKKRKAEEDLCRKSKKQVSNRWYSIEY